MMGYVYESLELHTESALAPHVCVAEYMSNLTLYSLPP